VVKALGAKESSLGLLEKADWVMAGDGWEDTSSSLSLSSPRCGFLIEFLRDNFEKQTYVVVLTEGANLIEGRWWLLIEEPGGVCCW
jgi:hypothetical protein